MYEKTDCKNDIIVAVIVNRYKRVFSEGLFYLFLIEVLLIKVV